MDTDKPSTHLFFCFTSSSSSMKISSSSRPVLSPARTGYSREPPPPITLSTSLSRRLSKSRSIRGGAASPAMFPVTGKKRGSGFDNPEPSSPKVTCIGQVRVKTRKKHVKNVRSLSTRRKLKHSRSQRQRNNSINSSNNHTINNIHNNNGNNQRWVHIPMTICEALRTSCLFPCRASNEEKKVGSTRWVVALEDGEVEMVGGGDDDVEVGSVRRHHVFDDLEIVDDVILGSEVESVGADVIPPKNALLLMRGRSDPVKMEALANQLLEEKHEEEFEEAVEFEEKLMEENRVIEDAEVKDQKVMVLDDVNDTEEINMELEMNQSVEEEEKQSIKEEDDEEQSMDINEEDVKKQSMEINKEEEEDKEQSMEINEEEESYFIGNLFEENADEDQEIEEEESDSDMKDALEVLFEEVEEAETGDLNTEQIETEELILEEIKQFEEVNDGMLTEFTEKSESGGNEEVFTQFTESYETEESKLEQVKHFEEEIEEMLTEFIARSETEELKSKSEEVKHFEEENEKILTEFTQISEILERENEEREKIESLPECLLLMMYEPKLSMEVSKETWVCRNDFIRTHSSRKKPPPQPPVESIDESKVAGQTSCSIAASDSMMAMLERKLVSTMGFEPLELTRCKSEPMRRARETCCLQNQLEPPRRASFGVGMAGLAG